MSCPIPVDHESPSVEVSTWGYEKKPIPIVVNELNFIPGESVIIECLGSHIPATIIKETAYYLEYSINSTETPGEQNLYVIKASESPMKFYGLKTRLRPVSPFGIPMPTTEEFTRDYVEIPLVVGELTFIPGETVIMAQDDSRTDIPEYTPVWSLTIASDSADKFEYIIDNTNKPKIISREKTERKGIKYYRLKSDLGFGRKKSRKYKTRKYKTRKYKTRKYKTRKYKTRKYKRSRLSRRKKHH